MGRRNYPSELGPLLQREFTTLEAGTRCVIRLHVGTLSVVDAIRTKLSVMHNWLRIVAHGFPFHKSLFTSPIAQPMLR